MVVVMRPVGSSRRVSWTNCAGMVVFLDGRAQFSTKRQSAHPAELVPWTVVMAAHLTGNHRTRLGQGPGPIYSGVTRRFRSDTLHSLERLADRILTWLVATHIGLKTLKKLICSRIGAKFVFGTRPSGTSGRSRSLFFGVHDRFQVRSF